MIFNPKAAQKNAGQKLTDHYLLNELWSELDDTSQAAVSGGVSPAYSGAAGFGFEVSNGRQVTFTTRITNTLFTNNTGGSGY